MVLPSAPGPARGVGPGEDVLHEDDAPLEVAVVIGKERFETGELAGTSVVTAESVLLIGFGRG